MRWLLATALILPSLARAHVPTTYLLDPAEDWCARLQIGLTGDLYKFLPGDYYGPCVIDGPPPDQFGERLFLRAFDADSPGAGASVLHHGTGDAVISLTGFDVSIEYLQFRDVPVGVDAIRLEGEGHVLLGVVADGIAGVGVQQGGDLDRVEIRESRFSMLDNGAIRLGCLGCASGDANLHDNLILGSNLGILGAHGAWGVVRDNFIGDSEIGLVWDSAAATQTVIEENFIATRGDGIRLVGGQILARNNVVTGAVALASIGPGSHRILGNTLHNPSGDALRMESWGDGAGLDFRDNAVSGVLPEHAAAEIEGNASCGPEACGCWIDAASWDFYPTPGGPLIAGGVALPFGDLLADWCGDPRPTQPTMGAFQALGRVGPGPVTLVGRAGFDCDLPPDPPQGQAPCDLEGPGTATGSGTGTGAPSDSGAGESHHRRPPADGCGCDAGAGGAVGVGVLLALLGFQRRRRI